MMDENVQILLEIYRFPTLFPAKKCGFVPSSLSSRMSQPHPPRPAIPCPCPSAFCISSVLLALTVGLTTHPSLAMLHQKK